MTDRDLNNAECVVMEEADTASYYLSNWLGYLRADGVLILPGYGVRVRSWQWPRFSDPEIGDFAFWATC
jgi:hypothetical protein